MGQGRCKQGQHHPIPPVERENCSLGPGVHGGPVAPVPSPEHYVPGTLQARSCALLKDGTYFPEGETEARTDTQLLHVIQPGHSQAEIRTQAQLSPEEAGRGPLRHPQPPRLDLLESEEGWLDPVQGGSGPVGSSWGLRPEAQRCF